MNIGKIRARMVSEAERDIEARRRRLELLKAADPKVIKAAATAFKTPEMAVDWLMTATVSIGDMTPLDMATDRSGRSAVLKILSRISIRPDGRRGQRDDSHDTKSRRSCATKSATLLLH